MFSATVLKGFILTAVPEVVVNANKLLLKNSYGSGEDDGYSLNQTKSHTTSGLKEKQTH